MKQRLGRSVLNPRESAAGFSLVELLVTIVIAMILAGIALPLVQSAINTAKFNSAVTNMTGAIQAARYQAIFHGLQYQIAFSKATKSYQVSGQNVATGPLLNVGGPMPIGPTGVTLGANATLLFHPSGLVEATAGNMNNILVTYKGQSRNISVSRYGRTKSCTGSSPCP